MLCPYLPQLFRVQPVRSDQAEHWSKVYKYDINTQVIILKVEPDAPQGAALYDRRGWTLNSWGKYGHNIQAWYSSEF